MSASVRTVNCRLLGQIGAVAVAQRNTPTHDVVAEPFQGVAVHAGIMTHEAGNVEPSYPFCSICCTNRHPQAIPL